MHIADAARLQIQDFLPLENMRASADSARDAYLSARPFPHVVLDNLFDPALLDQVLAEFPSPSQIRWERFNTGREIKLASEKDTTFGPVTRLLLYHLNSISFLDFLSHVTGIEHLIPDPTFDGGGLHQIVPGGKLGVHADYNKHPRYELDRRLNVLIYLNKDWNEEYGGHLELWDRDMTRCEAKVLPVFNRMMVFGTTDFTFHGHPDPLRCPEGMSRKSLALYYFSNGRPPEEVTGSHRTIFKDRAPGDLADTPAQLKEMRLMRMRGLVKDLLPPIVTRQLQKRR